MKIHKLLDGAVLFETDTSYDKLNFFCFNNIFAVINVIEHPEISGAPEKHIKVLNHILQKNYAGEEKITALKTPYNCAVNLDPLVNNSKNFNSFRVVISNENKPAAIDEKIRFEAEKIISRLSGLKVNRNLSDTEFWFLFRREDGKNQMTDNVSPEGKSREAGNFSVFMKRLTLHHSWDKILHKGELPPPLAWTMCRIAGLVHSDIVLDPFCGYGSIPGAVLKYFHITNFIACDNNAQAADFTANRFKKRKNGGFVLYKCDFTELSSLLGEKSINAVITDPPWGHYRANDKTFLVNMFNVFGRLLKDGGRAVVLYANDDNFINAVPDCFKLTEKIPILLSGKKAVIYKFIYKTAAC